MILLCVSYQTDKQHPNQIPNQIDAFDLTIHSVYIFFIQKTSYIREVNISYIYNTLLT